MLDRQAANILPLFLQLSVGVGQAAILFAQSSTSPAQFAYLVSELFFIPHAGKASKGQIRSVMPDSIQRYLNSCAV